MKVIKIWLECEDSDGKHYMMPATTYDIRQLQAQTENSADEMAYLAGV